MKIKTNLTTETITTPLMPDRPTNFKTDPLWQRLEVFSLDEADASFPFSAKLAKENNWDAAFAQATILEYKRFVYLCCTLPQGASPPPIVDEVWHLHLCYTVNYWEVFCETILERKLHHHPSKGGPAENEKHHHWLDATLANYRNIFGTEPPSTIWNPAVKAPVAGAPIKNNSSGKKIVLVTIVIACLVLSGCSGSSYASLLTVIGFSSIFIAAIAAEPSGNVSNNKKGDGSTGGGCSSGGGCSGGDGGGGGGCGGGCGGCGGGCGS